LLFLVAAVVLLFTRLDILQALTARDGHIIVNSPTVYTRQRLVNDRLSQAAWLQEQLLVTKGSDPTFRSLDQVRVRRSANATTIGLAIGPSGAQSGNVTLVAVPAAKPDVPPSSSSPPAEGPAASPESNEPAIPLVDPTTADLFRAKNTYREEVRAEMMETQLDDRHDIRGNTIYRLAFDATILAGTRKDSLAVVKVKLSHDWKDFGADYDELYAEWLRYMQKVLDVSATGVASSLYNRAVSRDARLQLRLPRFLSRSVCYFLMERNLIPPKGEYDVTNHPCNDEHGSPESRHGSPESRKAREFLTEYIGS
jgi:hypothetical protein